MKKILTIIALLSALAFTSCKQEEVFYSEVVELAGEWKVTVDQVDANGNVIKPNLVGTINLLTYNTAANNNEMWIDDLQKFWSTKIKVNVDLQSSTFTCTNAPDQYLLGTENKYTATITDGRINYDGTKSPLGHVVDEIVFTIQFSDAPGEYYRFQGYRRTGFNEGAD